ncbi:MAG: hypothetical protein LBK22_03645, partial [Tannerella sp.]|nr:hypothetical protein [Tannerella sp.]
VIRGFDSRWGGLHPDCLADGSCSAGMFQGNREGAGSFGKETIRQAVLFVWIASLRSQGRAAETAALTVNH